VSIQFRWLSLVLAALLPAQTSLSDLLKSVEDHYNRPRTMQVLFEQSLTGAGRIGRLESGVLYLRKPGRMRWEYHTPEGKLFLADGKDVYFYSPATNRVEKSKLKESDDLRAPLAFLMGRVDFHRDFREFRTRPDPAGTYIVASPKSDKAPYTQVEFLIAPTHRITQLKVHGHDRSVMSFRLSNERINPPLDDNLFQFRRPAGAEIVDIDTEGAR
jgi:outer membrane lipoprotein carrier protein